MTTIHEVATAAGVSASTVSRVFARPDLISEPTRTHVHAVAERLDYRPNHAARALITGRTRTTGLVVPDIANPFFPPLIKAAQRYAWEAEHCLLLANSEEDRAQEWHVVNQLSSQVDGVALCSSRLGAAQISELAARISLVLVNRRISGIPCVLIDSGAGVRQAVDHLAGHGHRAIAYVAGPRTSWSNQQRRRAVRERAKTQGMELELLGPVVPSYEAGRDIVDPLLATRASAVIAYDDVTALGVLAGLAARGMRVPEEVSVVGCDDVSAATAQPPLTTISARCDVAGQTAMRLLLDALDQGERAGDSIVRLPASLVVRSSTGPA